jgi:hypothetical protein
MKKLILLLLLIPQLVISQNSWFNLEVQFDYYGPSESFALITQQGDTLVNHTPTQQFEFYQTLVYADSGDIDISLFDSFGDGWTGGNINTNSGIIANILVENACQGVILDLDVTALGSFSQYDTTVNLLPCPPPVAGCMDPNSVNYDSLATIDDGSCLYEVDFSLNMNQYNSYFTTPYVVGPFNNWTDSNPMVNNGNGIWETTIALPAGFTVWKFMLDNFAEQELPPNVQNDPLASCFVLDQFGFTNRTLDVTAQPITLPTYCWESCFDCGTIFGCTDPTSNLYNPWATLDDGSCVVSGPSGCDSSQTYLKLVYTPDNWPQENEIVVGDPNGTIFYAPQGTYNQSNAPAGIPIEIFICVDTNVLVDITLADSYGDGYGGSTSGGSVDGNLELFNCDGVELFDLVDSVGANFGYSFQSDQFNSGDICTTSGPTDIPGCMNPFSTTYDSSATIDDGSCGPPRVVGCTDPAAFNYDPNANQTETMQGQYTLEIFDGAANGWSGTWLGIKQGGWLSPQYKMGPNDGTSLTFNVPLNIFEPIELYLFTTSQSANTINQVGYTLSGPTGDTIVNVPYWGAGPLQYPIIQTPTAQPFYGDVCVPVILGCMDSTSFNYIQPTGDPLVDVNTDDGSCEPIVVGCMNSLAFNYDSTANVDDPASCIPVIVGCMDPSSFNYIQPIGDPLVDVNTDDPSLCIPVLLGCTDPTSFNYDPNANTDDGSCIPVVEGCTDVTSFNYDPNANTDDGSCIATVLGCIDPLAFNYDPLANTDDGSCIAVVYGCTDPSSFNYDPLANTDNGSCVAIVYGCMDSTAFNYNPLANTDNGTCEAVIEGCTDPSALNYDPAANTDDGSCEPILFGCTDSTAFNYNPLANTDDGSCIPIVYGCTDPSALNYDPTANTEDFSCVAIVYGCMDSTAVNYDPLANVDNGSCITAIIGCTDPNSYNYNPEANVSDPDSCLYDAGCITGPGEPYWLNNNCYAWVIDVDNYCCDNDWDPVCQEMYNYCENGWPDGIDIDGRFSRFSGIVVYPNPVKDIINIVSDLDIRVNLYDVSGKILRENTTDKIINLSNLPSGIYFLNIEHEGNIYNKRIIKE